LPPCFPFSLKENCIDGKKEINKSLLGKVEFSDVSISLFRHFPKLSVALEDVSVVGINEFSKDTLLSAKRADAALHLWSAIRGEQMQVYGVYLQSPRINALVNREGKANWEITIPDSAASAPETTGSGIRLDEYRVTNGYLFYRDETSGMEAEIGGLNHNGSGNLAQDAFTLSTKTSATSVRFIYGGIPYLAGAKTGIDADFIIDTKKEPLRFQKAAIAVNDLKLTADGFIQLDNDSTYTWMCASMPVQCVKDFLSLVPAVYKNDFGKLKTSGTAALKGFVQGVYGPKAIAGL
jgi:uncharacterized protein involved in outer membrane biogenesis